MAAVYTGIEWRGVTEKVAGSKDQHTVFEAEVLSPITMAEYNKQIRLVWSAVSGQTAKPCS